MKVMLVGLLAQLSLSAEPLQPQYLDTTCTISVDLDSSGALKKESWCKAAGGSNVSPMVSWKIMNAHPEQSTVIVAKNMTGGVHWSVYDIQSSDNRIPTGFFTLKSHIPGIDAKQGRNYKYNAGWDGPCNNASTLMFKLYVIKQPSLDLPPGASYEKMMKNMLNTTLGTCQTKSGLL